MGNGSHTLTATAVALDILVEVRDSDSVTVTVANDITPPSVSINQAATQADPTSSAPILFTAVFSDAVSGFTNSDVVIGGTAGGTKTVTISGGPSTYTVAVSGMTTDGTVIATIPAGAASDGAGNANAASTSTDNAVTFSAGTTVTRFEEGAATYTGTWFAFSDTDTGVTSSNGIVGASQVAGSTSTFTFTGTRITWIGFPCEICGIANVYLDAGDTPGTTPIATVDTFAATRLSTTGALWTSPVLVSGTYTVRIEVTDTKNPSSGDFFIIVDAFDVTGAAAPPVSNGTPPTVAITSPASGETVSGTIMGEGERERLG